LKTLDNWAQANLSKESYEALTENLNNAAAIKALEELRGKMMSGNPVIPNGNDAGSSGTESLHDIQSEITNNLQKYKTDPKYRAELQGRLEVASKNSGVLDKSGP
jgi:Neuraminidase (sialidase)